MPPGGNTEHAASLARLSEYADRYDYGYAGGCWVAIRLDAPNAAEPLSAATPEGLAKAIADDWDRRSAS